MWGDDGIGSVLSAHDDREKEAKEHLSPKVTEYEFKKPKGSSLKPPPPPSKWTRKTRTVSLHKALKERLDLVNKKSGLKAPIRRQIGIVEDEDIP